MRKIVQSTLISLDGVVDDPGSWAMKYFNQESAEEAYAQLNRSDGMLMGRNSYRDLAARWRGETGPFAERMREIPKHVFSSTVDPDATDWANATVHSESPLDVITRLRSEGEGDLTIYGHTQLGQTLLAAGLVDEWIFSVHPVLVGRPEGRIASTTRSMELIESHQRQSGVVVLRYRVAKPRDRFLFRPGLVCTSVGVWTAGPTRSEGNDQPGDRGSGRPSPGQ